MFQALIKNRWRWILISSMLVYLVLAIIVWKNTLILEHLDFTKLGDVGYWNGLKKYFNFINALGGVLIFSTSSIILSSLLFIVTYYLRLYQNDLRIVFQDVFDFLSLIPCVFWSFIVFLVVQIEGSFSVFENVILLLLVNSIMIFPMLLNAMFKAINSLSDGYIQTGYALGANSFEIGALLVAPKLVKRISVSIILIFTRLIIELAILGVAIGVFLVSNLVVSIILFMILSGALVFLVKRI